MRKFENKSDENRQGAFVEAAEVRRCLFTGNSPGELEMRGGYILLLFDNAYAFIKSTFRS